MKNEIMPKLDGKSADLTQNNIDRLKKLFPEVVKEGKVDIDAFRDLIGSENFDTCEERFGLNWAGKTKARREAQKRSTGTLRPCKSESKEWETTGNVYIEGDNLEVLKLLQKSYHGKVKMIYIDPPYNTGKDFVYRDNYADNMQNYLEMTGQDAKLSTNTESDGRFHSNWLNMMYPRLKLARNLLTDDGVIFISIDDNEQANLKKLCDEIFGEENFVTQVVWQARQSIQNDTDISESHEYILSYAKNRRKENRRLKESNISIWYNEPSFAFFPKELDENKFANPDNDPRGKWKADPFDAPNIRPNLTYEIINPNTLETILPPKGRCWRTGENEYKKLLSDNRIVFGKTGNSKPQLKVFYNEKKQFGSTIDTWFDGNKFGTATKGTKVIQSLFNGVSPFDTVKPIELIYNLCKYSINQDDIILDFFSGSATTAHAVMQLNAEDGGKRKYICVQIPEPTPENSEARKAGYATIPEIAKERIRRAGKKIEEELKAKEEKDGKIFGKEGEEESHKLDTGFKVFKLDSSNIHAWDGNPDNLEQALLNSVENIKTDRTEEDLLYEILLKFGMPLTEKITRHNIAGKTVFEMNGGSFFACLADDITVDVAEGIAKLHKKLASQSEEGNAGNCRVVFKDMGFNGSDEAKVNSVLLLKQYGIENVTSV